MGVNWERGVVVETRPSYLESEGVEYRNKDPLEPFTIIAVVNGSSLNWGVVVMVLL